MVYKYRSSLESIEHFAQLLSHQRKEGYCLTAKEVLARMAETEVYQDVMGHAIISQAEIEKLYEEVIVMIIKAENV